MNNNVSMLSSERERLKNNVNMFAQRLDELCAPIKTEEVVRDQYGEGQTISHLDIDSFSVDERMQYDYLVEKRNEQRAKLCLFETYVKSFTPASVIDSYNAHIESLDTYKDVTIHANSVDMDKDGNFVNYSTKVGNMSFSTPESMSFDEYKQFYTSNLTNLLTNNLNSNLTQEEVMQEVQNACSEVYMQQKNSNIMSLPSNVIM